MRAVLVAMLAAAIASSACVSSPEHLSAAGFKSKEEASGYVPHSAYFSKRLTAQEWSDYYSAFPEYWQDMQSSRNFGATLEFHPWYTAYAYRWTTLKHAVKWPQSTLSRLQARQVAVGDEVMQLTYALGAPARIIWDRSAEALIYADYRAFMIRQGKVVEVRTCRGCSEMHNPAPGGGGMSDAEVRKVLGLPPSIM